MIRFNRTTEYGLIALRHMSRQEIQTRVSSAREISEAYGLPFEITAKTLLKLKDGGLIESAQGSRGGYTIRRSLKDVTLAEFLNFMEGDSSLVHCCAPEASETAERSEAFKPGATSQLSLKPDDASICEYQSRCQIQGVMGKLNQRVHEFLSGIKLCEFVDSEAL